MANRSVTEDFALLTGRVFLSSIFVLTGLSKMTDFAAGIKYMAAHGMPFSEMLLVGSIFIEVIGGLMVMLGWKSRIGAFLIFIFIIPASYYFHQFWAVEPARAANQMHHFMKNGTHQRKIVVGEHARENRIVEIPQRTVGAYPTYIGIVSLLA